MRDTLERLTYAHQARHADGTCDPFNCPFCELINEDGWHYGDGE